MQWLNKILEAAVITDGRLDTEALTASIGKEMAKHTVTKDIYDDLESKYAIATNALKNYEGMDLEQLQKELISEKAARANDKKEFLFKATVKEAGATDADYLLFKHGIENLELDEDGKIKDLDSLTKNLKETYVTQFSPPPTEPDTVGGLGNFVRKSSKNEPESIGQILGKEQAAAKTVETDIYFK